MTSLAQALRAGAASAVSVVLLAACGSSVKLDDTPVESRTGSALQQPGGADGATRLVGSGSGTSGSRGGAAAAQGTGSANPNSQTNVATIQAGTQGGTQGGAGAGGSGAAGSGAAGSGAAGSASGTSRGTAGAMGSAAASGPAAGSGAASSLGVRSGAALPAGMSRIVFFDFDSFVLRDDARPVVEAHARILMADRSRRLLIDGHTDERGSREYNLALGQKRADAVARALVLLGVQESQIEAVSFGEERPSERGAGETAWSRNRRAELKDRP